MKNILLILFVFISGCATIPKNPNFTVKSGDTVGILIDIPEELTHTFIGTTIFNNFEKKYPFKWGLEAYAYDAIAQSLINSGYKIVNLQEANISYDDLKEILIPKDKQWVINPKNKETYNTLQKLGIKSAIYFRSAKTVAFFQCGMSNCTDFYTKSYGLFTRSFIGIKNHIAVAAFDNGIVVTNPLAKVDFIDPKTFAFKNFKPADLKNITEEEWTFVKYQIIKYIDDFSTHLPQLLNNNQVETL